MNLPHQQRTNATLRASRTLLLSAPCLHQSGLLFSPCGTDVQGRFWCLHHQIWSGWASSVSETLRLHLLRALSLHTRLLLLISRSPGIFSGAAYCEFSPTRARGIVCICLLPPPPLGLIGPRLSASSSSPRLLLNLDLVTQNFGTLSNNRYSMTLHLHLQLRDRRDISASLESSPNAPELFHASWVRGGIAKILLNRTVNAVLVQGL